MNHRKKKMRWICLLLGSVIIIVGAYYFMQAPVKFQHQTVKVEINSTYDAKKNIAKVRFGKKSDIKIDDHQVNYQKLGRYPVIYSYKNKQYQTYVKIVDRHAPDFDTKDIEIDLGMDVNPQDLVEHIKDATQTKVYFKKKYTFNQEGIQEVIVCVKDEGKNVTEKKAKVNVVKDSEAPTLTGLETIYVTVGGKIDYQKGVTIQDNRDSQPQLQIDSSQVNLNKPGTYYATYIGLDRSGNKVEKQREVKVVSQVSLNINGQTGDKVVYLTFDDGPSLNTKSILDILDRYNAKATFFVTGRNQDYNYLIKEAYNRGNTIGLHTYCHDYKSVYTSKDAYFEDLDKVGNMVKGIIGYTPRYIRFPGGSSNTVSKRYCTGIMSNLAQEVINRGYQYYDWNVSSSDAEGNTMPVNRIINQSIASKSNKINILFHDSSPKTTTVEALPTIIEHYQALGYRFEGINDQSFVPHQRINN